jgi:site-specific recombinase XerD
VQSHSRTETSPHGRAVLREKYLAQFAQASVDVDRHRRNVQYRLQAMRLPAALARFETQLHADGRSPHTVAQYARHVRRFASWLQAEHLPDDVAALEPEHLARFLASAEAQRRPDGRTKQSGSLNALRSSLRGYFEYLERAGFVERCPVRVLRMRERGEANKVQSTGRA